jgi:hypothetical protein
LIDPDHPGEVHLRKKRPVVPMASAVCPWVIGLTGKLIRHKVPIAMKNRVPGGPTHFEKETRSIKTAWNAACREADVF